MAEFTPIPVEEENSFTPIPVLDNDVEAKDDFIPIPVDA